MSTNFAIFLAAELLVTVNAYYALACLDNRQHGQAAMHVLNIALAAIAMFWLTS